MKVHMENETRNTCTEKLADGAISKSHKIDLTDKLLFHVQHALKMSIEGASLMIVICRRLDLFHTLVSE